MKMKEAITTGQEKEKKSVSWQLIVFHAVLILIALLTLVAFIKSGQNPRVSTINRQRIRSALILFGGGFSILFIRFHFLYKLKYRHKAVQRMMRRRLFDRLPLYVLWGLAAVLITMGFYLRQVDRIPAEEKIVLFLDTSAETGPLAAKLDESLPAPLRWIEVRDVRHGMFYEENMIDADIWILKASHVENMREYILPGHEEIVYRAETAKGPAQEWIRYLVAEKDENGEIILPEAEDYVLLFSRNSLHTGAVPGADESAFALAELFLKLP